MKLPLTGMLHADPCMGLWEFRAQGQSWFLADQWPNISKLKSCLMGLAIIDTARGSRQRPSLCCDGVIYVYYLSTISVIV